MNAPRTQSLRDRVLEASAELVEVGAAEGPPLLPIVAEATNIQFSRRHPDQDDAG